MAKHTALLIRILSVLLCASLVAAGRAWAGPSLVVVDSGNKLVGYYGFVQLVETTPSSGYESAVRSINGVYYALPVLGDGFQDVGFGLFYKSSDCSGTPFFEPVIGTPLVQWVPGGGVYDVSTNGIFNNKLYYGVQSSAENLEMCAVGGAIDPTKPPYSCRALNPCQVYSVVPIRTFDLSTLKLTPPFKVKVMP